MRARILLIVIVALFFSGCAAALTAQQAKDLTPEQIRAYKEMDMNVYGCLQFAGPPPAGGTTWLVLPKSNPAVVTFLPNCFVQMSR